MSIEQESTGTEPTSAALLDAALLVIGERGVKGATTRLIAERAGVNEVPLFRKFGTKSQLIRAAIENRFAAVRDEYVGHTGDLQHDLTRLADGYAETLTRFGPAARVILAEAPHRPELSGALAAAQQAFAALSEVLERYQREGVLRPEPMETLVPAFLGPILMTHVIPTAGGPALRWDAHTHVDGFLHGRATN